MKNNTIKVPFFLPYVDSKDITEIKKAALSSFLTNGPKLDLFEQKFKKFTKSKYAVGVSNATSALYLSLKALGIKKNDEVIIPDLTFAATANSVLQTGATPVLADINEKTLNISAESIIKNISRKTKAIIPVHLAGTPCDMQKIMRIARSNSLKVIEDCAHGIGTSYNKKHVGNFGNAGCFSFYPTKNLTTIEGGMVITNDKKIADFIQLARNHGMSRSLMSRYSAGKPWEYDIKDIGYNYRLDDIRSALGISQLQKLTILNKKRLIAFSYYNKGLKNIPGLIIPNEKNFKNNSCHLYIIRITSDAKISRDKLFYSLQKKGIGSSVHYKPLHEFTLFRKKGVSRNSLSISKRIYKEILSLPMYPQLARSSQDYVIKSIKNIFLL
jgi:dTDP-4-amino-4,6-dideoxygalactose transaminase